MKPFPALAPLLRFINSIVFPLSYLQPENDNANKNNTEISLHHSQTYHFGFPNGPFQLAKRTFLSYESTYKKCLREE